MQTVLRRFGSKEGLTETVATRDAQKALAAGVPVCVVPSGRDQVVPWRESADGLNLTREGTLVAVAAGNGDLTDGPLAGAHQPKGNVNVPHWSRGLLLSAS